MRECRYGGLVFPSSFRKDRRLLGLCGVLLLGLLSLAAYAPAPARAAVMPFPEADIATTQPIGLDPLSNNGLPGTMAPANDDGGLAPSDALKDAGAAAGAENTSKTQMLDGVLGIDKKETWADQTRDAELTGDVTAVDLMRAYVNVVHSSGTDKNRHTSHSPATGEQGKGFLMSLAEGLDDPRALSLITKVVQPYVENDAVNFSILGFGRFMMVGDANSGELSVVNLNNGRRIDLRSGTDLDDRMSSYPPGSGPPAADQVPLLPHEGETLAKLLLLLASLLANPIALISISCLFGAWFLYRVAKRLT